MNDEIYIEGFAEAVKNKDVAILVNKKTCDVIPLNLNLTERQREILLSGGMLSYTKSKQ